MKLNARITFAAGVALAVIVGALLLGTGIGHASEPGPARRGQPCPVEGSYARDRSGDLYICEQRAGDECPVYHAAEPRPGKWGKPSPCVCPSKSPSGSPSAPSSPSKPATASPKPAATLPVTGDRTAALLILSGAAISGGALLLTVARRRRTN